MTHCFLGYGYVNCELHNKMQLYANLNILSQVIGQKWLVLYSYKQNTELRWVLFILGNTLCTLSMLSHTQHWSVSRGWVGEGMLMDISDGLNPGNHIDCYECSSAILSVIATWYILLPVRLMWNDYQTSPILLKWVWSIWIESTTIQEQTTKYNPCGYFLRCNILTQLPLDKRPPLRRRYFQMYFREWKVLYFV